MYQGSGCRLCSRNTDDLRVMHRDRLVSQKENVKTLGSSVTLKEPGAAATDRRDVGGRTDSEGHKSHEQAQL